MKAFEIKGEFPMGEAPTTFTKQVAADDEEAAREYIYSIIGSRHRIPRRSITFTSLTEIEPSAVTDPVAIVRLQE